LGYTLSSFLNNINLFSRLAEFISVNASADAFLCKANNQRTVFFALQEKKEDITEIIKCIVQSFHVERQQKLLLLLKGA